MNAGSSRCVVAAIRPWNVDAYERHAPSWPGRWNLVGTREELTAAWLREIDARYVFFPHWSWRVPDDVLEAAECVCFHMTDVPYGRGGSPLQNLIVRGHEETMVTALRMVPDLDAGPVYMKRPLSLGGRAQDIYERAAEIVFDMIGDIARDEPAPAPQTGEPVFFERRTPEQSRLPGGASESEIHDHIRMLDAEDYPHAFLEVDQYRLEFTESKMTTDGGVTARVRILPKGGASDDKDQTGEAG